MVHDGIMPSLYLCTFTNNQWNYNWPLSLIVTLQVSGSYAHVNATHTYVYHSCLFGDHEMILSDDLETTFLLLFEA